MKILHGLTGSVASTLYPKINDNYNRLKQEYNHDYIYVCTKSSCKITDLTRANAKFDEDEWNTYKHNQLCDQMNLSVYIYHRNCHHFYTSS